MGGGVIGGQSSHRVGVVVVEDMASMSPVTITKDSHSSTGVHPVPEGLCGRGKTPKAGRGKDGHARARALATHRRALPYRCKGPCTVTPRPTGMFRH